MFLYGLPWLERETENTAVLVDMQWFMPQHPKDSPGGDLKVNFPQHLLGRTPKAATEGLTDAVGGNSYCHNLRYFNP